MIIPVNEILLSLLKVYENDYLFCCDTMKNEESYLLRKTKFDDIYLGCQQIITFYKIYLIGMIMRGNTCYVNYSDEDIKRYISTCVVSKKLDFLELSCILIIIIALLPISMKDDHRLYDILNEV